MSSHYECIIHYTDDMVHWGTLFAQACGGIGIVFLQGELGTGKTTFCRGVLRHFGYTGAVKSPTYTLVEPYTIAGNTIYHFDLYRLTTPEELEDIGGRDYFQADSLCLVEWPAKGSGFLPTADITITLAYHPAGRKIQWQGITACGRNTVAKLANHHLAGN